MLNSRWRKVMQDVWGNRTRTALVVLSIAVGVFAVGMIATTQIVFSRDLAQGYAAINPASATLYTQPFDDELVQVVRGMPGVREAEGRSATTVRLQTRPGEWRDLQLFAVPNYKDIRINKVWSRQGAWPPPAHELLIERSSLRPGLGLEKLTEGTMVEIETPGGKHKTMRIAGVTHDIHLIPAFFAGQAYGFITFDTMEWLGEQRSYDQLSIIVTGDAVDKQHIQSIVEQVRSKVEKSGRTVYGTEIPTPGKHPMDDPFQAMTMLLTVLAFFTLLLSGFLVVNTVSALLVQQIRQIGVMKAVGARAGQIIGMYLTTVVCYGLLSLIVGIPLGLLGARATIDFLAGLFNLDIVSFGLPPQVFALQLAVGLLVPFLAALYPVISGTRVTVREAISTFVAGGAGFGKSLFDRLLEQVHGLPRPQLLSLRNTFRRKGRLMLTLTTLTLAGAIFIAVVSVRASLLLTLDHALAFWNYDVGVDFSRNYRTDLIEREAMRVPGVVKAESWGGTGTRRVRQDGSESNSIMMIAPPAATDLLQPIVTQGRWLLPEDENAIVINTDVLRDEPDLKLGDEVVFKIDGRDTVWHLAGVVRGVLSGPIVYTNYPYFGQVVRDVGHTNGVQVLTEQHDPAYETQVAKALESHFEGSGLRVRATRTTADLRQGIETQFNIIVVFLLVMAVLLAVVGGLGLMGTMSINVLERTREIGVMRAIGASDRSVRQIFITEGIIISLISWLFGAVLAYPLGKLMSHAVGLAFMRVPLDYTFAAAGVLLWLGIVAILAAVASFLPAWNASRLSVREILAYE